MLKRREFLLRSAGLLGLATIAGCGSSPFDLPSGPVRLPFETLARALQGELLLPGMPNFDSVSAPWNLRYASQKPAAVARCISAQDIQAAIQWAIFNRVPLVCRSGGHSYSGFSLTPGLMIDVSQMNQLSLDPVTGLATLGAGARNRDVYAALRAPSVSITHGRCRGVGVAGLVLGGGIGFNMRLHGLTCDQLVETEIATAQGQLLTCNANHNAELFWACRGAGGGNFGIHTSFTFQTFPVSNVTVFSFHWDTQQRAVFETLLATLGATPDRLGAKAEVLARAGQPLEVQLLGQLHGLPAELNTLLAPVMAVAAPSFTDVRELPYWDAQEFLSEDGLPGYSKERSRYLFNPLSGTALDTIFANLNAWPGTTQSANWKAFLMGGAVSTLASDATAYAHRAARLVSSCEVEWGDADSTTTVAANLAWVNQFHQAMEPFTSGQCYQNFIDDDQADYLRAYYANNLERLVAVKARYDPNNVFHYPQSIPTRL